MIVTDVAVFLVLGNNILSEGQVAIAIWPQDLQGSKDHQKKGQQNQISLLTRTEATWEAWHRRRRCRRSHKIFRFLHSWDTS